MIEFIDCAIVASFNCNAICNQFFGWKIKTQPIWRIKFLQTTFSAFFPPEQVFQVNLPSLHALCHRSCFMTVEWSLISIKLGQTLLYAVKMLNSDIVLNQIVKATFSIIIMMMTKMVSFQLFHYVVFPYVNVLRCTERIVKFYF